MQAAAPDSGDFPLGVGVTVLSMHVSMPSDDRERMESLCEGRQGLRGR